jgi:hypothetical protein
MGQQNVRVVVGQGDQERQGFLRTVLEDGGFDVVGEAATASHLARLLTDEQPDVIVLDDAIGVDSVRLATELAPTAKLIVVWPSAVVPIAGATRVEPSEVLTTLTGAVGLAAGIVGIGGRPDWIEKVQKDPSTLREMLAARGGVPTRPSVTELQRRGHRLHPSPGAPRRNARAKPKPVEKPDDRGAIVTPIPIAAAATAGAASAATQPTPAEASWNRRLGIMALGGAAVAGALMLALAFSNRGPDITAAEPFFPPIVQPSDGPTTPAGDHNGPGQNPGGTHTSGNTNTPGGTTGPVVQTTSTTGNPTNVRGGLSGPTSPGGGTGTGGAGTGGTTTGSTGNPGGPRASEHLPGTHANSGSAGGQHGGGNGGSSSSAPGQSASHNPHGGPPGWGQDSTSAGPGQGSSHGGGPSSHANPHATNHTHKQ